MKVEGEQEDDDGTKVERTTSRTGTNEEDANDEVKKIKESDGDIEG